MILFSIHAHTLTGLCACPPKFMVRSRHVRKQIRDSLLVAIAECVNRSFLVKLSFKSIVFFVPSLSLSEGEGTFSSVD